jgi:xyloglucan-specific exo-beta-1,4-glucanase
MRHARPTMVAIAVGAMVITLFMANSVSNAGQNGAKKKHNHSVAKHKTTVKHHQSSAQVLGNAEMEEEQRLAPNTSNQWFEHHKDLVTGIIPAGLTHSWHDHDLMTESGGSAVPLASPMDTVLSIGPFKGPYSSGRTRAVLVSSASDNTIFAGGVDGGLWKSTNAGANWSPINDQAENLAVTCITQSPFTSNNIYYATGEPAGFVYGHSPAAIPGDGVFKSTDGGSTFTHVTPSNFPSYVWAIAHGMNPSFPNTVYVGTDGSGLWSTTDGGTTWNNINVNGSTTSGTVCDILPFASGAVIVAKNNGDGKDGLYYSSTGASGTFTKITSAVFPTGDFGAPKLANCKTAPNVVYVEFPPDAWGGTFVAMCVSTDGGTTWSALGSIPDVGYTYESYNRLLGVNPNNSSQLICGGSGWFASTNGGTSWFGSNYAHDQHGYSYCNSSHNFYITDDGGVKQGSWDTLNTYRGQHGINFTPWWLDNGYVTTQFWGGNYASANRACLGITQDDGLWRFSPDLDSLIGGLTEGCSAHISQQDSNLAYFGHTWGNPYIQSTTKLFQRSGASTIYNNPWNAGGEGTNPYNFFQSNYADGLQLYYRTSKGVWRTIDSGHTWTRLNATGDDIQGIQYIGCTNATNPSVYFTTNGVAPADSFYRVTNAKTFTPGIPTNLSASIPSAVAHASFGEISQTNSGNTSTTLFMCTTNYSSIPHIYKVTNANGSSPTWTNITGDLPSTLGVNEVQADPNSASTLIAATDYGLYYSTNAGTNWIKETRFPNTEALEMQLRTSDRKLFVFTQGRGVWYCSLAPLGPIVEQASVNATPAASTFQFGMYPTPATSKLNITLKDNLSSSARMVIYDMTGHMVSGNLWNAAGGESQEADISKLASGVYFLQIQDGDKISTQKFEKL